MIYYKNARETDMIDVAKTHRKIFTGYFLSALGVNLLAKYYTTFLRESNLFILACDDTRTENGGIIGFCMGCYLNSTARKDFEQANKIALVRRLLVLCLSLNRQAIDRCVTRLRWGVEELFSKKRSAPLSSAPKKAFIPHVSLLSIGVLPQYRGCTVSTTLLHEYEKRFQGAIPDVKIESCCLTTSVTNTAARRFYEKNGFSLENQSKDEVHYIKHYNSGDAGQLNTVHPADVQSVENV